MSVPFLDKVQKFAALWPNALIYVEWAPGANLAADPATWTWTDITSDVLQANDSVIQVSPMGRSDAASTTQPAGCSFTLDNRSGAYSRGPQSSNYPNIVLNIPLRVSISLTGLAANKVTRFQGYVWSMRPSWDSTGNWASVAVQAAGIMRRLGHGTAPLHSAIYREITTNNPPVAYWPMEDASQAARLVNAIQGGAPITFTDMSLAGYSGIAGSDDLPTFTATTAFSGPVSHTFASHFQVNFLVNMPNTPAADVAPLRIHIGGGDVVRWEIVFIGSSTSQTAVRGYDSSGTLVVSSAASVLSTTVGRPISIRFFAKQNGANINWTLAEFFADSTSGALITGSIAGTVGNVNGVSMLASANMADATIGHLAVYDQYDHAQNDSAMFGWLGDSPDSRVDGLTSEEGIPCTFHGSGSDSMGTQDPEDLMTLLREAETASQGILGDGLGPGLYFGVREDAINRPADVTLAISDLAGTFQPEGDDDGIVNKASATRKHGSTETYEQVTGPLGTAAILDYADDLSGVNVSSDDQIRNYASWMVYRGTSSDYRYPSVSVDWRRAPSSADEWLAAYPGCRLDVTGVAGYATQHPGGNIELRIEGWQESLSRFVWSTDVNCSPYGLWRTVAMDDASGTYAGIAGRLDTGDSTLATGASAGALSLSVASTTALWTTAAADFPMSINVNGWQVTVTSISGTSSPQTFTVSATPAALPSGASVSLWRPSVMGL